MYTHIYDNIMLYYIYGRSFPRDRTFGKPTLAGFRTGAGQRGFSQKVHKSHTFCHS